MLALSEQTRNTPAYPSQHICGAREHNLKGTNVIPRVSRP